MGSKPKFAYITAVDISINNGPGINEREFVKRLLAEHANNVTCILPFPSDPDNFQDDRITYVTNHKGHHPLFFVLYCRDLLLKTLRLKREGRLDAVAVRVDVFPVVEIILSRLFKLKMIFKTLQGGTFRANTIVRIATRVSAPFRNWVLSHAVGGDTVGSTSKRWIMQTYRVPENKIEIIPNGVNTDVFHRWLPDTLDLPVPSDRFKFLLGYVGTLRKISHIDMVIEAMASPSLGDGVGFVIVGNGPEAARLKHLAKMKGIEGKIFFAGNVPYAQVPKYLSSFDMAVDLTASPIKIGDAIVFGSYSQKIPQYLACGLPIIAWDLEDTAYIEREHLGQLVPMENPNALIDAIKRLCSWLEDDKESVHTRCRRYAESELSTARLANRRVDFWEKTVASN